ncbi:serine hydrolase domain-containing protein [Kibdelosporangium aridum]|uniref:serine hydrolase domain-containing protein n=1 Tax=Kibdelosporangium aridum TaxID=2030 RepID=UPI0035EEDF5B
MRVLATVLMLVISMAAPAAASPANDVAGQLVRSGFPGAVAYVRVGDRVDLGAAGLADIRTGERATPGHRFRIASHTKTFTAAVILQLVRRGQLTLDTPVRRWLPSMPESVTVRQLLDHTRGLHDPTNELAFWRPYLKGNRWFIHQPKDIVANALTYPLASSYSNTNYLALGLLIEKITGHSAVTEIQRRIFEPLRLKDTTFPTIDPFLHGPHLRGYDLHRQDFTVFSPSYDWTAGAIVSTVEDLARFYRAQPTSELGQLGLSSIDLPCPSGPVQVWRASGGGPGYNSYALISEDRAMVFAGNVYDIVEDVMHRRPMPEFDISAAMTMTFCGR